MTNDTVLNMLNELRSRLKEQHNVSEDSLILWHRTKTYLETEPVSGIAESSDKRFICIPVRDEESEATVCMDGRAYMPQCFEVLNKYETYLSNGFMVTATTVWVLRRA